MYSSYVDEASPRGGRWTGVDNRTAADRATPLINVLLQTYHNASDNERRSIRQQLAPIMDGALTHPR